MAQKHGIFIYEEATAIAIPQVANAGLEVIIGTAPINMMDDPESLVNVPILATKATEAMATLGYVRDFEKYTLCQSMYVTSNLYQVTPVIYINVLDPKKHKKAFNPTTVAVSDYEATVPLTGVLRDGLKVSTVGTVITYSVANPAAGDNPATKKWFELRDATYVLSTDTSVKEGTIYFKRNFVEELDVEGDPSDQGLYELVGREYVLTNDTFANPGKSYYSAEYKVTATPEGSSPAAEGWFVLGSSYFVATSDTAASASKTYFIKTETTSDVVLEEVRQQVDIVSLLARQQVYRRDDASPHVGHYLCFGYGGRLLSHCERGRLSLQMYKKKLSFRFFSQERKWIA